ncbi:MAG: NAD(P)-binding protein [Magnetococcales bacterium]|nr:NAD(P)-binding protein [Magnetococcales bacterium]MBF0151065.1 NAD(P)-binding protein [Magnetococcales bacterium]
MAAAWTLVQRGHEVTVIEKELHCGGMASTFSRGNFRFDLGPHIVHSPHTYLIECLRRKLGNEFRKHDSVNEVYFNGCRVTYPFSGFGLLKVLSLVTAARCVMSYFSRRIQITFKNIFKDDGSYHTWLVNRFGAYFFDIFFGPYTEKVWGVSTMDLSDIIAKRRIPVRSLHALVRTAITRRSDYHPENSGSLACYYHSQGSGKITEYFHDEILRHDGKIITNAQLRHLTVNGRNIVGVEFFVPEQGIGTIQETNGEHGEDELIFLSTIPINHLIRYFGESVPEEVRESAARIDYTAMIFLYLELDTTDPLGVDILYFSEKEFPFNRISDVGKFSRDMVPAGRTALCLEITCTEGDAVWHLGDQEIYDMCLGPLERHGFLTRKNVLDYHTRRLTHAYPRFRIGYERHVELLTHYINHSIDNLRTFGRQGLFSYINTDEALLMGFEAADRYSY